jgi:hypothetical protein
MNSLPAIGTRQEESFAAVGGGFDGVAMEVGRGSFI